MLAYTYISPGKFELVDKQKPKSPLSGGCGVNVSSREMPAFCGLCKEIITFVPTLYQKFTTKYERDKSPRDNTCIRL